MLLGQAGGERTHGLRGRRVRSEVDQSDPLPVRLDQGLIVWDGREERKRNGVRDGLDVGLVPNLVGDQVSGDGGQAAAADQRFGRAVLGFPPNSLPHP